jgi:hypothetical protein
VALDIPYKTHLRMLRDAFDKAPTRGVNGMKVRGGRALVAANLSKGYELWPEPEFIERTEGHTRLERRRRTAVALLRR